jgi:hypothetical protein
MVLRRKAIVGIAFPGPKTATPPAWASGAEDYDGWQLPA